MKKLLQSLFLLLFLGSAALAQERTITGTVVSSEDNMPVPGVTVRLKDAKTGTSTGASGNFSLRVPAGSVTLEFTSIGFVTQTVTTAGNSVSVSLKLDAQTLSDVVVTTALGIKRSAASTSYSNQTVDNKTLTEGKVVNLATGLQSKVAGLQINLVNNGVNPSTRVVLRGNRSITGNNQALIVVDGVPVPNSVLSSLNPNDVAEVNVLKGANAASLYGSEGVNGVLIITTKKGSKGRTSVNFSSTTSLESVAYMPKMQDQFGAGYDLDTYVPYENTSWGPAFDGSMKVVGPTLENGAEWILPYSAIPNEKRNFWDTGTTFQNDLSFSGGDEKSTFYFSLQDVKIKGITPKDENRRTSVRFNADRKFGKLSAAVNMNYTIANPEMTASSVYNNLLNIPQNIPITQLQDWRNNQFAAPNGYFSGYFVNPYWEIDNNRRNTRDETVNGNVEFRYDFAPWLNATYRLGAFNNNSNYKQYYAKVSYTNAYDRPSANPGSVTDRSDNYRRLNSDLLLQANKTFGDFKLDLLVGNNVRSEYTKFVSQTANALVVPELYNISNRVGEATVASEFIEKRQVALFGEFNANYKDFLYLTLTGRQEWVSVLSKQNRSYFYPAAGLSFVFTKGIPALQNNNLLSFGKIFVSANKTANVNLSPYALQTPFNVGGGFPYGNLPGYTVGDRFANPNLQPEFVRAVEAGVQLGFFRDRLNLEAVYGISESEGQILPISTSYATGYSSAYVNAGLVRNKSLELSLRATPIRSSAVEWTVGLNFTHLDNEVVDLYQGLTEIPLGGYANSAYIYAVKGQPYPVLKTTAYQRDPAGRIVVNGTTGYPIRATGLLEQGQTNAPTNLGFNTSVSWKGFTLAGQLDYRTGNVFYNILGNTNNFTGLSYESAQYGRQPFVVPNSVIETSPGVYQPNTSVKTQDGGFDYWYGQYNNIQENYVTDASFLKLRELSLTYQLPAKWLAGQKVVKRASLGVVGRNLFTWLPKENIYTDPEFNFTDGNAVGISDYIAPPTRIYGFNLNVTF
ncbi:SusC/RagA family TonB-linked outer membrane protein [Pedobacter yulinensis]|uniref:SusC/RagA family TonB-linked outer membrane protein n=1 Tax=Pedobacter yulinensis TaxID=2126353 RepID=A0A2T3HRD0_9SPHI|nr:SusC/RagA family TonB-linked outer membrane protein [Pedobacter yulinensis]PST85002.1 SusC/RagA family TonB-linked outer membrane protein [Pedobacter yulinensis]